MESETLTEKESLEIISRMIRSAKTQLSDDGIFYLMWGWAVFVAAMGHFLLLKIDFDYPWIGWMVLMPLCAIATFVIGRRKNKQAKVKTFVEEFIDYLWMAFGIVLLIVLFFMAKLQENTYPIIMLIYGIGTFVSGGALKFMPLKAGGVICWLFAVGIFFHAIRIPAIDACRSCTPLLHHSWLPVATQVPRRSGERLIDAPIMKNFKELDPLLHSQLRLAIVSLLVSVREAEFIFLKEKTNATAGNLSVQIQKLKDADYITVQKKFKDNYPQTICRITKKGIAAFESYVEVLKEYIGK
jgi:hypothetical protein